MNWTYVDHDAGISYSYDLELYFDYNNNNLRMDAINPLDSTLPTGANGQEVILLF